MKFWFSICKAERCDIKEFLAIDAVEQADGDLDQEVTGLAYDSRKAGSRTNIFRGTRRKSRWSRFYPRGALRRAPPLSCFRARAIGRARPPRFASKDTRRAMGLWAAHFFDRPSAKLTLVGITGTNGKTTLTYLIESMLQAAALEPGVIGTINYRYRGDVTPVASYDARVVRLCKRCSPRWSKPASGPSRWKYLPTLWFRIECVVWPSTSAYLPIYLATILIITATWMTIF